MKSFLPFFILSGLGLFAADPTPAPGYSMENCVNHFDPAKVEKTAAGSQYWFADTDLAHGKTVKLSIVGPHLATHPPHRHAEDEFFYILSEHLKRYPAMEIQDCYKLVHQACLGSEHAVSDGVGAQRWMERELATMGAGSVEPLVDPISPDGSLVRVHLRTFMAKKGDPKSLTQSFVQTAATKRGSLEVLAAAWAQVVDLAATGGLPFTADAARDYGHQQAKAGWPAVHHSEKYRELYRPAYRVIAREHLAAALPAE